jgi:hypothetical protein
MRFTKLAMGTVLVLAMGMLVATGASAQVLNDIFGIQDDNQVGVEGAIDARGDNFEVGIEATCHNGEDTVFFTAETNHPDAVNIGQNSARINQGKTGNEAIILIVTEGAFMIEDGAVFNCHSSQVGASVNANGETLTAKFKIIAKNCDTNLSASEVAFITETCADTQGINGQFNEETGNLKSLKIKGKGNAFVLTES